MKLLVFVVTLLAWKGPVSAEPSCLVDLVFCIDNSESIGGVNNPDGGQNWKQVIAYSQNLTKKLNVGALTTHIGAVDFGYKGYFLFDFKTYLTESAVVSAIGGIAYRGEYTNTTGGLYWARQLLTDPIYGSRPDVPKVIVLITDGNPNRDQDKLPAEVALIKSLNIRIVAVAVGAGVDEASMKAIASYPTDYVYASDFNSLTTISESTINEETCKPVTTTTTAAPTTTTTTPTTTTTTAAPTTTPPPGPTTTPSSVTGTPGAVYVRWGRKNCPPSAKAVYTGQVAGSHYAQVGSGHEYLCVPDTPQWGNKVAGEQGWTGFIWGTEFELNGLYNPNKSPFSWENNGNAVLHDNDVPCVVCVNPNTYTSLMIPAAQNCLKEDWTLEYTGYLVSEDKTFYASQYVCLDVAPEVVMGGLANLNGALFYPVQARCGSLPCPKYVESWEITCAVCSK